MTATSSKQSSPGGAQLDERPSSRRARAHPWAALALLALPCLVVSMDNNVLGLAIPALSADLHPSAVQLLWIGDAYTFVGAAALLVAGSLGDRLGHRRQLLWGAIAFGACSVLAAFAPTANTLIVARALLGAAGALLLTSTLALVRTLFHDGRRRRTAVGIWTASFAVGGLCGPIVGGLILSFAWWGAVFLVAVPVMALLAVLGPVLLREGRSSRRERIDLGSAVLSLGTMLAFVAALKDAAADGPGAVPAAAFVASAVLGGVFLRRQRQLRQAGRPPLVDLELLSKARIAAPLLANAVAFFVLYGTQLLLAQYLQLGLNLSPLAAGLWGIPGTIGYLLGALLAPMITRRTTPVRVVTAGLVLCAAGFTAIAFTPDLGLACFVTGAVVSSVGLAPVYAITTDLIGTAAPPDRPGATAAVTETGAELGGALGIALLGSLATAIYQASLSSSAPDEARATLGGAVSLTQRLPEPAAGELRRAATEAFAHALTVAELGGAALLVAAAIAFPVAMRRTRRRQTPQREAGSPDGPQPTGEDPVGRATPTEAALVRPNELLPDHRTSDRSHVEDRVERPTSAAMQ